MNSALKVLKSHYIVSKFHQRGIRKKRIITGVDTTRTRPQVSAKKLLEDSVLGTQEDDEWTTAPYPAGVSRKQSQGYKSFRPKIDPRKTSIILFPGQGAQYVGMNKRLMKYPEVQKMYEYASDVVKFDLSSACLRGPKEFLDKTVNCQTAILVTNLASVCRLKDERPWAVDRCVATAGFSVGEIAALVFAGCMTFEDAVQLVYVRGQAMQHASERVPSGLMTVFYGHNAKIRFACTVAEEWCKQNGIPDAVCRIANYLYPESKALDFISTNRKDFGILGCKRLPVSGAFHTPLMQPAVEPFVKALRKISLSDPQISVHSGVDGSYYKSAQHIFRLLPKQICSPLKWEQIMHVLYERNPGQFYPNSYECGPGTTLQTILKRINQKASENFISIIEKRTEPNGTQD